MPDVQINYQSTQDMVKSLQNAAKQLEDTYQATRQVVSILQGGGLVSTAGDRLVDALNGKWLGKIQDAQENCDRLAGELNKAMQDMSDQDTAAQGRFQV